MPNPEGPSIPKKDETINEMLARLANIDHNKFGIVSAIIRAAQEMDPAALKTLTTALEESKFKEIDEIPINDERFQEICGLITDHSRSVKA
jgi:F0F1-type ATP synthase delta subunit